jgi:hypothetical protein
MGKVISHMTMSLDGFIADSDDQVGRLDGGHLMLEDRRVVQGRRALHLTFQVRR